MAEHGLTIVWAVALVSGLYLAWRHGGRRLWLWSGLSLLLYALLVVPSDLFGRFAVSARHVRVLAPFLCLATAGAVYALPRSGVRRAVLTGVLGFTCIQAAFNFRAPLTQLYPAQFLPLATAHLDAARKSDLGPYDIVNGDFLHNPDWVKPVRTGGLSCCGASIPSNSRPISLRATRRGPVSFSVTRPVDAPRPPGRRRRAVFRLSVGPARDDAAFPGRALRLAARARAVRRNSGRFDLLYMEYGGPGHFRLGLIFGAAIPFSPPACRSTGADPTGCWLAWDRSSRPAPRGTATACS